MDSHVSIIGEIIESKPDKPKHKQKLIIKNDY